MHKKLFTYVLLFSSVLLEIGCNHTFYPLFHLVPSEHACSSFFF